LSGSTIDSDELGVVAEAAARVIDTSKPLAKQRGCRGLSVRICHDEDRRRPERGERDRRRHEPPDTTTGGSVAGTGAADGAGVAGGGAVDEPPSWMSGGAG